MHDCLHSRGRALPGAGEGNRTPDVDRSRPFEPIRRLAWGGPKRAQKGSFRRRFRSRNPAASQPFGAHPASQLWDIVRPLTRVCVDRSGAAWNSLDPGAQPDARAAKPQSGIWGFREPQGARMGGLQESRRASREATAGESSKGRRPRWAVTGAGAARGAGRDIARGQAGWAVLATLGLTLLNAKPVSH